MGLESRRVGGLSLTGKDISWRCVLSGHRSQLKWSCRVKCWKALPPDGDDPDAASEAFRQ